MTPRVILHADMDAFYASVEQRDRPELRGKPVIIGAESARGVVAAASYEARTFGVRSAMPGFRARELCPDGVFLAGDMRKYAAVSRQVHRIFLDFTDLIEPLALDEAFLDIGGSLDLFGGALALATTLKNRISQQLGLIVSVGVAPNKLVAKIACTQSKPDGLFIVKKEQIPELLGPLPVRALWGVGPKTAARLQQHGFNTIGDIAGSSLARLRGIFGNYAEEMQARAQGEDDRPVVAHGTPKSIGEEATFAEDVQDAARIGGAITQHSEEVAARARHAGYLGGTVTLKVKLARRRHAGREMVSNHELFPVINRQRRLAAPTADGTEIRKVAWALWEGLALTEPIRLLGVSISRLESEAAPRQLNLFAARSRPVEISGPPSLPTRAEQLGRALDAINDKFGQGSVRRAMLGVEKVMQTDKIKTGSSSNDDDE